MKNFLLPESLRNDLVNFLKKQPYENVAIGLQALMSLKPAEEKGLREKGLREKGLREKGLREKGLREKAMEEVKKDK